MSEIDVESKFDDAVKKSKKVFVLFYASWCPFSQRFLPVFAKHAERSRVCLRVQIDDKASLCDKYAVDFVPTVLVFENGVVKKRLDSEPHVGLSETKLIELLAEI